MYTVEYRRFYLRDIESIGVWPNKLWPVRVILPAALILAVAALVWGLWNATVAAVIGGVALAWVVRELILGPTALAWIRSTGTNVELPLVRRTRRARKVLARIDAAVRAARVPSEQASASSAISSANAPAPESAMPSADTSAPSATVGADATQTNGV